MRKDVGNAWGDRIESRLNCFEKGQKPMRDEFSQRVKDLLSRRVAFTCSNPNCRITTCGPGESSNGTVNIGVAAHITAASEGGPRYDPFMTPEERSSPKNGIWLCQNCAHKIDVDQSSYPVELLFKWKQQTEDEARRSLGRRYSINDEESLILMEAEELASEALECLRYLVANDATHLIREVVLLPNRNVIFGPLGGPRHEIYYEDSRTLTLQFQWLEDQGLLEALNNKAFTPLYRIPNRVYRWLQATI